MKHIDFIKLLSYKRVFMSCLKLSKASFVSLYALVLSLGVSLTGLHSLRLLSFKKEITAALYFQKQSHLYAQAIKDVAIHCLRTSGFNSCVSDSIVQYGFNMEYYLTRLVNSQQSQGDILLDVAISCPSPLSTHVLRFTKRYILKGFP